MAKKNDTVKVKETDTTEAPVVDTTGTIANDAETVEETLVDITLPIDRKSENQTQFVGLNGKRYGIQRGVKVEGVPIGVAKILENREKMLDEAFTRRIELQKQKDITKNE